MVSLKYTHRNKTTKRSRQMDVIELEVEVIVLSDVEVIDLTDEVEVIIL